MQAVGGAGYALAIAPDPDAPAVQGLFGMLRAFLASRVKVQPTRGQYDRGRSETTYAQGLVPYGTPTNDPSRGLVHRNQLAPVHLGYDSISELDKIQSSNYARPGLMRISQDVSFRENDDTGELGQVRWTGRKTIISAPVQPSPLTRAVVPVREPWTGADFRTAPAGAWGAGHSERGSSQDVQPGSRTRWRKVPTNDSTNPPPAGAGGAGGGCGDSPMPGSW